MDITPKSGELWERTTRFPGGSVGDISCMFVYEKDGELWGAWMSAHWDAKKIDDGIVDGKDGWRRVFQFGSK